MYHIIALTAGVLISVSIYFNGGLSQAYGTYLATVIIHAVGLAFISALVWRERPFSNLSSTNYTARSPSQFNRREGFFGKKEYAAMPDSRFTKKFTCERCLVCSI